jgi:hypothetical protein
MNSTTLLSPPSHGAARLLRQSPLPDLRRLEVLETEGEIIITGVVTCYYHKQLATETVRPVLGARRLLNQAVVPD